MISLENINRLEGRTPVDLGRFDSPRLNSAGELAVSPRFRHDLLIKLGDDALLEVSRVSIPFEDPAATGHGAGNLFTIRNLENPDAPFVVLDDSQEETGRIYLTDQPEVNLYTRQQIIVGTAEDATPQLGLRAVDPHHLLLRLGGMSGDLHFSNITPQGKLLHSIVFLDPMDANACSKPIRHFDDMGVTREEKQGYWTRPDTSSSD